MNLQLSVESESKRPVALPESHSQGESQRERPTQRNRPQLSCISCRASKLKCDRKAPCSQCVKKDKSAQCTFPAPLARRKQAVSMQSRLKHLESLVQNAMTAQSPAAQNTTVYPGDGHLATTDLTPQLSPQINLNTDEFHGSDAGTGQVLHGANEATYVGGSNWAAIFENIEELQSYFEADEDPVDNVRPFTTLNFNTQSAATQIQLLATLPDRSEVNRLVSVYFNSNSPALQIIHKPTFQDEYQKFWDNMEDTPVAWLGLVFSILIIAGISDLFSVKEGSEQFKETLNSLHVYRESCIQCLLLSNYTSPGPHTIETLSIYMEGDFLMSKDDQIHLYLLVGNTVRLAMRMGIHRDSTRIGGNITPFQAEMRRRLWHHLVQIDILSSFHIGLPGATQSVESDTKYPSNLRDEDFDKNSPSLPPARPESEFTPMTYTITKSQISHVAGKIAVIANRLTLPPYEDVMKLDEELRFAHSKVPSFFQLTPQSFITDSPERVIKRFSIALLYQKSLCLLHRAFVLKGIHSQEYSYSRKAGLQASIELLKYQSLVLEAALPGGPIFRDRWFLSSLSMHDFLMAAMVVFASIMQLFTSEVAVSEPEVGDMIAHLSKSHDTWTKHWTNASEAKKAASILAGMLKRIETASKHSSRAFIVQDRTGNGRVQGVIQPSMITSLNLGDQSISSNSFQTSPLGSNWASSDSTSPSSGLQVPFTSDSEANTLQLEGLIDFSGEFDWELFDNELRPPQATNYAWPDMNNDFVAHTDVYY